MSAPSDESKQPSAQQTLHFSKNTFSLKLKGLFCRSWGFFYALFCNYSTKLVLLWRISSEMLDSPGILTCIFFNLLGELDSWSFYWFGCDNFPYTLKEAVSRTVATAGPACSALRPRKWPSIEEVFCLDMGSHHFPGEEGKDKGYCSLGCLHLNNGVLALMCWKLLPGAIGLRVLNMRNQELFGYLEVYILCSKWYIMSQKDLKKKTLY